MKILSSLILIILLFTGSVNAAVDPCAVPCALPCNLTNYGGTVTAVEEVGQRAAKGMYEVRKATHYERQKIKAMYRKARNGIDKVKDGINKLKKMALQLMSGDFSAFSSDDGKSTEKPIVQDTQPPKNASTLERVQRNTSKDYYNIETQGGFESEYAFQQRRSYIRQQATLKYVSRVMILKTKYKDIVDIVNSIEKNVDQSSNAASNQDNLEGSENKTKLLKTTSELKSAWEQLLLIQKQVESAELEYKSNIGLSNMKPVKNIPTVQSNTSSSSGSNK
ncbi:MAG: hypothetical protein IJY92_05200 [Alphaproteobacteria bacterium]|nr:hypothetical protein [Alphaproteobacteria bacterium]